ncbi:restriction endonuclease subunit S [[Ruminococcus] torques]|uniref:restriction endonuclease subunit S n=1 Tax=[Ruminococcus] torques TaxID=33039 RepID=UPI00307A91A9
MIKKMIRLGDVATYINGYAFKPEERGNVGLPIIRIQDLTGNAYDLGYYDGEYPEKIEINNGDVLISWSASLGVYIWNRGKALLNQHIFKVIFDKVDIDKNYFVYAVHRKLDEKSMKSHGATMKHIIKKDFDATLIPYPALNEQIEIADNLDKVLRIIEMRKRELQSLDSLIKARFVEMFGDPVSNPYGYNKVALSDLADIKIGPFGSLLHKEDYIEGGHPLLNPSHIVDGKVSPDDKLTISDEKYEELSAYQLKAGDVVMGRRGEMGRCAVVSEEGFLCGTGSILIRTKGEVTADYIQKIISFPSFKKTIEDMAVGQTMPNLNVPIVASFQIIKPPVEVQNSYYAFVEQVDKSKVVVQKALDETQLLFDSLMQKYFG